MNEELREYRQAVVDILKRDYFPETDGWAVLIQPVEKNNGLKLNGIAISKADESDIKTIPIMYTDGYYYKGFMPEATANEFYIRYQEEAKERSAMKKAVSEGLFEFEKIKDRICYRLINAKANREFTHEAPTLSLTEDLMLSFYIQLGKGAVIAIKNNLLDKWGLNRKEAVQQLYCLAEENVKRIHPLSLESMDKMMKSLLPDDEYERSFGDVTDVPAVYIASNESKFFGASVIAYGQGDALEQCRKQMESDLGRPINAIYIIPSSVHEVILLPADDEDVISLQMMIQQVNRNDLLPHEVLSDNVFYYDRNAGLIQIEVTSKEEEIR